MIVTPQNNNSVDLYQRLKKQKETIWMKSINWEQALLALFLIIMANCIYISHCSNTF